MLLPLLLAASLLGTLCEGLAKDAEPSSYVVTRLKPTHHGLLMSLRLEGGGGGLYGVCALD